MKTEIKAKPIRVSEFSRSPVDIIIPFYKNYNKVIRLARSIVYSVVSNPYQITLVDDCSPNEEFIKSLKDAPQIKTVRNNERLGFGGALFEGFKATKQPYVMFMHSDCLVEDKNWMIELGKSLLKLKKQNIGLVSAKTDNPGDGAIKQLRSNKNEFSEDIILTEGYLPLYCAMARRELFSKIQGFIKPYPYGGYEDEELAYRMKKFGYGQAICGRSWIRHEGGATIGEVCKENPEIKNIIEGNRDLCLRDLKLLYNK